MIKKVFNLIKLFFTNHRKFSYFIKHYQNSIVKNKKSKKICAKNDIDYKKIGIARFNLNTFDNSNQYTHPDSVFHNNKYHLVMTPYPYGMEAYENPCLYVSDSFNNFVECTKNPIADQGSVKRGNHLSDPFFCVDGDKLIVLYRKNETISNKETVSILYRVLDKEGQLSEEKSLIIGHEHFLSPILFKKGNSFVFQYMNKAKGGSEIKQIIFDNNFSVKEESVVLTKGFPENYYFWHFGIRHEALNKDVIGLVLIRSCTNEQDFILCTAKYDFDSKVWNFDETVVIPEKIKSNILHIYKSCFVPNENKILLSFKDKKGRYYCSLTEG